MFSASTLKRVLISAACLLLPQAVYAKSLVDANNKAAFVELQTSSKQPFTAYVVGPKQAKQAILLIHGWWGLNRQVVAWANEYAVAGYRVMAIDLYHHQVTSNASKAKKLMQSVKQSYADGIYATAINSLSMPGRKIAIIGHSYGAAQAIHAAMVTRNKVAATVVYYPYGDLDTDKNALTAIKSPILGHFARKDFFLTTEKLTQLTSSMKNAGLSLTVNVYEARHGFDNPSGNNFNEVAYKLAEKRTQAFLDKYLR